MVAIDPVKNLGSRFVCFKCSCKFYDLSAPEPLCPRCGADQRENPNPDPRAAVLARYRRPASSKKPKKAPPRRKDLDEDDEDPIAEDVDEDALDDEDGEELLDEDFDEDEEV